MYVHIDSFWVDIDNDIIQLPGDSKPWSASQSTFNTKKGMVTMTIERHSLTISLGDRLEFSIRRHSHGGEHYFDFHIIKLDTLQTLTGIIGKHFYI